MFSCATLSVATRSRASAPNALSFIIHLENFDFSDQRTRVVVIETEKSVTGNDSENTVGFIVDWVTAVRRTSRQRLEKAPAMIIPCLYGLSSPTQDVNSILAGSSIYLAVQNMLLAARALGLGTVMTTVQMMLDANLRQILDLPDDAHPVALIPIGYPDANFGPTTRKGLDEILRWNGWG